MLQTIREHTQGWIAGTIITIIILTFALWGIHSYFVGGTSNNVVAQVNGTDITRTQLSMAYERLRRQVQAQSGLNAASDEKALKNRALQTLIDIEVLKQASLAQGFEISDRQIDNYLQSMPAFQVDGQFSVERFQEVLASSSLSTGEFMELIKTSLIVDQPKLGIVFTSFALPEETNSTVSLVNQERNIAYMVIPLQYFLAQALLVPQEDVQTYYKQHQNEFMTPEQVSVDYLELSLKDLAANINPSDDVLKAYYNENINSYALPMAWRLVGVQIPVADNASPAAIAAAQKEADTEAKEMQVTNDFSKITKKYSLLFNGQDWVTLEQMPSELQTSITSLIKPGQTSAPIKTAKGFVIVKILNVREPKIQSFTEVKDKVRAAYAHQHAEEKFAALREQLADLTYEHSDSLQTAAKTLNLPIKTSELFSLHKAGTGISQNQKVRETAFSNDVLNLQNNSDVIQLNPETVIVLRVKSHLASILLPLNDVIKQIESKLKTKSAEEHAVTFANNIKVQLQSGANPQALLAKYPFTWSKAGNVGRYSTKVDTSILDIAFRLPQPANDQNKLSYGIAKLANGYAIVAVDAVKNGTIADSKQYAVYAEQVQNSEGLLEYELYKQSQTHHAKIQNKLE